MRIDDHAGIHHLVGIEDPLELAERVDQVGMEHLRQQLGAREPVAMLARERTAKLATSSASSSIVARNVAMPFALARSKLMRA